MARRDASPDFIEALARGLDVIRVFRPHQSVMSLTAVAGAAGLARPTARRVLLTLQQLGYVRPAEGGFELTPRVLELGMSYVLSRNLWEVARPHMERLVVQTHESSSIAQLDGSDIVYVAQGRRSEDRRADRDNRDQVPGHADIARQGPARGHAARGGRASPRRAEPIEDHPSPSAHRRGTHGHAAADPCPWLGADRRELAAGIRSAAAPLRDGDGQVIASLNVNTHAAETPVEVLTGQYLPLLLQTASAISADWAAYQAAPQVTLDGRLRRPLPAAGRGGAPAPSSAALAATTD